MSSDGSHVYASVDMPLERAAGAVGQNAGFPFHVELPLMSLAAAAILCLVTYVPADSVAADYTLADPALKVVRLDSSADESFFSVRADSAGRLFVGGREALFVYEPDDQGGYRPRQLLYRFPPHTWVNDVAIRGDDLYVLTVSALYRIPGAVTGRVGLKPQRLIWGVPLGHVHQCFHGLGWGPEGDLYLSMGDPVTSYGDFSRPDHWMHWTFHCQPEGTAVPYTGVGGIFRCRPDGSHFRVIAGGLRNACGLAFDAHYNLFTNDNDHESLPADYVPGRLLHVTPHADFAWPRGWMPHKQPGRADLLETLTTGLGRCVPVGQAYYGDTFLPEKYRDNLLLARWCTRAVTRFPLQRRGASFKADENPLLAGGDQARPVGVSVGRGGRLFVTVAYMAHNDSSPIYKGDLLMITRADDSPLVPFAGYEAARADAGKLWSELSDPSWSRRAVAHEEIVRRGGALLAEAAKRLGSVKEDDPALEHLIWLAAAHNAATVADARWTGHADPPVRLQAIRALAEFVSESPGLSEVKSRREGTSASSGASKTRPRPPGDVEHQGQQVHTNYRSVFVRALADVDPAVRLAALAAFFDVPGDVPDEAIAGPARSTDTYLRQAAVLLLAERAPLEKLAGLSRAEDRLTRLAGVLAVGSRLTLPSATAALPPYLPLDKPSSTEAYVIRFADAKVDLRDGGVRIGNFTFADHWRAGKHTAEQERLFALLQERLTDADGTVRSQAAHYLYLLNDPRSEPAVAKVRNASAEARLVTSPIQGVRKVWLAGPFTDGDGGFRAVHPPEGGPIDLSATYLSDDKKLAWKEEAPGHHFELSKRFGPCDRSSFYAYFHLESVDRSRAQLLIGSDDGVKVWHNGKEVWNNDVERGALPLQDVVPLDLQPGGNDLLVRVRNIRGDCGLYLNYRAAPGVVARLPEALGSAGLADRLKSAGSGNTAVDPAFLKVDWSTLVAHGDVKKGRLLFGSVGCAKCHAIAADTAVSGGPSLADARKRFTVPYLVESVLLPSKQISPVFRATLIETKAGQSLSGLVVKETAEVIELLLPDATRKEIAKKNIDSRKLLDLSPMPAGIVKTPEELRDILAYLLSESPQAP
jgi:putative heme-binding domain-containing protein